MATLADVQIHSLPVKLAGTVYYLPFATIPTVNSTEVTGINSATANFPDALSVYNYLRAQYPQFGPMYIPPYPAGNHNAPTSNVPTLTNATIENVASGTWAKVQTIAQATGNILEFCPSTTSYYWLSSDNLDTYIQVSIPIMNRSIIVNNTIVGNNLTTYTYVLRFRWTRQADSTYRLTIQGYASTTIASSQASRKTVLNLFANVPLDQVKSDNDPYTGAGYPEATAPGGMSQGSFDFTEDGLTAVHTPSMDVLGTGLVTCWNPSKAQLAAVASWLWSTQPAQILQDLLGNPINAIIGLNILPVQPDVDGGTNTIHFGPEDTAVAAPKCTSQYVTVDCGSLKIEPKYGSYMDYAPPASAELFLPYCGGVPLDINDVIDKTITIKYQVDILSGACVAYVFIDGTLHYQRPGACAATVPITGVQMPNVVSGALSIVGAVAGAIASLGASGAGTAAKVASGIATGTSIASTAANMLKQQISYSGTVSGWAGLLGAQTPYVILTLPHATIPGGQNVIMGYPAWVSGRIGDFSGYTECKIDHVFALGATDAEVDEIKTLLEGGVIL